MTRPVSVKLPPMAFKPAATPLPLPLYYVQSGTFLQQTNSNLWNPIAGLTLTLPVATPNVAVTALVTLNVPSPYAKGNNFPGCKFGLMINNATPPDPPFADITSFSKIADPADSERSAGRVPVTLVKRIDLGPSSINVTAVWQSIRGATCVIDSPASLSAIVGLYG